MLALAAATGSPARGMLLMAVFGIATIPALYLFGFTGRLLRPEWRQALNRVAAVLVILLGLLTLIRGTPLLDRLMPHDHKMHPTELHEHGVG
jgi:hypothetical protein